MFYFYLPTHIHSAFVPYRPQIFEKNNVNFFEIENNSPQLEVFSKEAQFCNQSSTDHHVLKECQNKFNFNENKRQKKDKKQNFKKTEQFNDTQYKPNKRAAKKSSNSKLNQNRNILPNTIHHLLSFVQRRNSSGKYVQRIFAKYIQNQQDQMLNEAPYSVNRFYIYQKEIKNKIGNYVTQQSLKKVCNFVSQSGIFSRQEQLFYNKIFRILVVTYLQSEGNCSVLLSKRMYNDKKLQHVKVNRLIKEMIKSKFSSAQIEQEQ